MLDSYIPDFEAELLALRRLAPSGYFLGFNYRFTGPELLTYGYPAAWREEYDAQNYFVGDPVLMWMGINSGTRRWSEIRLPDLRGVMRRAATHGLRYGLACSVASEGKRSIFTAARADREFTDAELAELSGKFSTWCDLVLNRAALTVREVEVLRLLRDGMGQREIAGRLGIAPATVKQRAVRATHKLGAANRIQAVAIAVARGYLE